MVTRDRHSEPGWRRLTSMTIKGFRPLSEFPGLKDEVMVVAVLRRSVCRGCCMRFVLVRFLTRFCEGFYKVPVFG